MRIAIDASRANVRNRTGTEWYSFEVISRMVRRHPEHQFTLYLREQPLPDLADLGSHVTIRVLRWPVHGLWNLVRLSLALMRERPDVLFVPAHTIPLWHPRATVTTLHDVGFERWAALYSKKRIASTGRLSGLVNLAVRLVSRGRYSATELDYHRWSARFAVRTAAHIITISEFSKQEICELYRIDPARLTVIHLGYSMDAGTGGPAGSFDKLRQQFNISQPYIYFIGRLEEKKNIRRILESYTLMVGRGMAHDLVLAGSPGLGFEEAYQNVPPSVRQRIHLLGWVDLEAASILMRNADVFFFPSLYEGFGLPILEAFAAGTPVVTAATASMPEVAGPAALLIDPLDTDALAAAVQRLSEDTELKKKLIRLGRERLAAFSWDRCAESTFAVLQSVRRLPPDLPARI